MLVLSRKKQESIRIGDDIEVVVLEVARNRVRLGFRCPPNVSITRNELLLTSQNGEDAHQELVAELALA
jgi:carbon storage regulator